MLQHTEERFPELIRNYKTIDKQHGRFEQREIFALATHNSWIEFDGVKQIAILHRKREVKQTRKEQEEAVCLITNIDCTQADAERLLQLKRDYWQVENGLHYRKDFVFGEDRSTIRRGHGPQNMSTLRNFAIGLLLSNDIGNVKRCVENLRYSPASKYHHALFGYQHSQHY